MITRTEQIDAAFSGRVVWTYFYICKGVRKKSKCLRIDIGGGSAELVILFTEVRRGKKRWGEVVGNTCRNHLTCGLELVHCIS